jgi:hypothetical protein
MRSDGALVNSKEDFSEAHANISLKAWRADNIALELGRYAYCLMIRVISRFGKSPPIPHRRFCHALAGAYAAGAPVAGYEVDGIEVARFDSPFSRSREDQGRASINCCRFTKPTPAGGTKGPI